MKNYIVSFCDEFQYPDQAKQTLIIAYEALAAKEAALSLFNHNIELYHIDKLKNFDDALPALDEAAKLTGVHKYSVHLLFLICLSKHIRKIYEDKNIPYEVFYDTMSDLKWKLFECHKMHDIWGSFVASWEFGFFTLSMFALGRLQYEIIKYSDSYTKGEYSIKPNDIVLNIHIPSCGPLLKEDCLKSYQKAAVFFKDYFKDRPVAFVCDSWLLYPRHKEFLPKESNILKFMDHFDIISSSTDEERKNLWRVFYRDYQKKPEELPRDTSIQRAYADWLQKGNLAGTGYGVFFFDGEHIL